MKMLNNSEPKIDILGTLVSTLVLYPLNSLQEIFRSYDRHQIRQWKESDPKCQMRLTGPQKYPYSELYISTFSVVPIHFQQSKILNSIRNGRVWIKRHTNFFKRR